MQWRLVAVLAILLGGACSEHPVSEAPGVAPSPLSPSTPPSPSTRHLRATRFLAFGDSLTAGDTSDGTTLHVDPAATYPAYLQALLTERAGTQSITVMNDGVVGETAAQGALRLPGQLAARRPDVLLLLEGINDIHGSVGPSGIPPAIAALRTMIQDARGVGAGVIIGTLLPARPGALKPGTVDLIAPFNGELIPMAQQEGAIVVDLHTSFLKDMPDWIGPDGLHPTSAGYREMAQLFLDAITANFEAASSSASGGGGIMTPRGIRK